MNDENEDQPTGEMKRITPAPMEKRTPKQQERGDLMVYIAMKVGMSVGRMAYHLQNFTLEDLYYLRSRCNQANNFGAMFWASIKEKK